MAEAKSNMELDPKYDHYDFPTTSIETREGHPGHLTSLQQAQVHQLRMMLESEGYKQRLDTLTLLRFLRARKFDVAAAKTMFIDSDKWRSNMTVLNTATGAQRPLSLNAEDPANNPPEKPIQLDEMVRTWDKDGSFKKTLSKYYKQFYHKTDKDGRPCYFEKLGGVDFPALKKEKYTNDMMLVNLAVEYEKMVDPRLPACSRQAGHLLETSCTILDVSGVSVFSPGPIYEYIKQTSWMSNNNYPERLGRMYIINSTRWQRGLWTVIRGFLDPVTASKIEVLSDNYKSALLKQIPAENLPASFGGECQCAEGCELSDAGPWHDKTWTRPAWWEKEAGDATIENQPGEIVTGSNAAAAEGDASLAEEAKVAA
ncbi:CRAL-TRIO domain-containing protein [Xylaria intraflava]|nr:CRAL-TRIO domain-containing protein [Xylaria intraflava]